MSDAPAATRAQQREQELCGGAVRALARDATLHFRGTQLYRGAERLPAWAAHLHPSFEHDDHRSFRGAADGLALRLTRSDDALHRAAMPADPVAALVFDLLEQYRVESLAPASWPGVAANLRHRHDAWSLQFHDSGLTDSETGLLLYTVAQMAHARVHGIAVLEATEGTIETTRGALAPVIGHDLAALRRLRHDQAAYAPHALAIAREVAERVAAHAAEADGAQARRQEAALAALRRLADPQGDDQGIALAGGGDSRVLAAPGAAYRAWTTAYDREVAASSLAREAQRRELREQLDRRIAAQGVNAARLARELQALLAIPADDGWDSAQEEGRIDGRRLARLVAAPHEHAVFRRERRVPRADAAVTLLIDCSGSMKVHAGPIAVLADVLARALEAAGAACEVLGFTTGAWNGGRARREWQRAGSPPHPGRLNEVCHLVFKDAATPWRRARPDLALLLKSELYREGVDGEAVDWACDRLEAVDAARRLLVVVSDGCPMDTATAQANDDDYLGHHLRQVVARREAQGTVKILGLGVGLDLSPYYRRSQATDVAGIAGWNVYADVLRLVAGRAHR